MQTKPQKYNFNSERADYQTPSEVWGTILKFIGQDEFDFDVCCSECNIPADIYNMPDGQYYLNIDKQKTKRPKHNSFHNLDGLLSTWFGACWLNPPYNKTDKWVKKAVQEVNKNDCEVWGIIPCRTETKFFKDCILQNPNAFFVPLRKGIRFINPQNNELMGIYKNSLCIVYFGKNAAEWAYKWNYENIFNSVAFKGVKVRKIVNQLSLIESR